MKSVNKELAILLKKAGFSEVTNQYYKNEIGWDILYDNYGNWNNTKEYISIPTIEEVLVWLRTKMGMHVYCIHEFVKGYTPRLRIINKKIIGKFDQSFGDNYDKAISEGIKEAIVYILENNKE